MLSTLPSALWLNLFVSSKRLYMQGLRAPSSRRLLAPPSGVALGDVRLPAAEAGLAPPEKGTGRRRTLSALALEALPARASGN